MNMPVFSRKWHIRRIEEELQRRKKAEEKAVEEAKRSNKKLR